MANNQYVNKVEFGNETIMDISSDTVTSDVLLTGYTAHDRSGAPISGSLSTFVQSGSSAAAGLVPAPSTTAGTTAFLCEDGSWKVPVDTTYSVMTGASASANGTSGLVPAPSAGDEDKFLAGDGTYKSGGMPMVVLSYGSSTWSDFINAYNNHVIVYCKASSNSNPASGAQTRMAFMAYVNADPPTNVEFQYYRSVSSHSSTQMGDQVFIYKLDKTSGWSVTTREASIKQITGSGITVAWSSNKVTLTNDVTVSDSLTDTSTTAALSAARGKALNDTLTAFKMSTYSSFAAIPTTFLGFCNVVNISSADMDAPYPSNTCGCWIVCQSGFGDGTRVIQIASQVFAGFSGRKEIWVRARHDSAWSAWTMSITPENVSSYITNVTKTVDLGTISAEAYGNGTASVTIPTGYKTTGQVSVQYYQAYNARGLTVVPQGSVDLAAGERDIGYTYYSKMALSGNASKFTLIVQCIKA